MDPLPVPRLKPTGPPVYRYKVTDSTNSEAFRLAEEGAPHLAAVLADFQTEGRGQPGRQWWMPEGEGILLSLIIRSLPPGTPFEELTLRVGYEIAQFLHRETGLAIAIKPPNDLHIKGMKVGGVLCEARWTDDALQCAVIGVGINVNVANFPPELRETATSLALAAERQFDRKALALKLVDALRGMFA